MTTMHVPSVRVPGRQALDAVLAGCALVVLSPVLVVCAFLVRLSSPGPVLFGQERLGRGRRTFTMYKFRTMRHDCDDAAHRAYVTQLLTRPDPVAGGANGLYKIGDDPRVTPVGRVLRRTSLDELPQLVNVIRGDMALVGPRPALEYEAELYDARHEARFEVPPGITGLWQVSGRSALTMRQALDLDVAYVQQRRLLLDLRIMVRTVGVLFSGRGAE